MAALSWRSHMPSADDVTRVSAKVRPLGTRRTPRAYANHLCRPNALLGHARLGSGWPALRAWLQKLRLACARC